MQQVLCYTAGNCSKSVMQKRPLKVKIQWSFHFSYLTLAGTVGFGIFFEAPWGGPC